MYLSRLNILISKEWFRKFRKLSGLIGNERNPPGASVAVMKGFTEIDGDFFPLIEGMALWSLSLPHGEV